MFLIRGLGSAPASPKTPTTPGTPSPPDYDTLSTHSRYHSFLVANWTLLCVNRESVLLLHDFFFRVSASDPPPDYAVVVPE